MLYQALFYISRWLTKRNFQSVMEDSNIIKQLPMIIITWEIIDCCRTLFYGVICLSCMAYWLICFFIYLNTCKSTTIYTGFQRRIIQFSNCPFAAPTRAPSSLSLTAKTSTSIEASWQLPPAEDRNGVIRGFKLFYKKKGSSESITQITINSGSTLTKVVTGLDEYTEYEFEVLAFTSVGDGPKSSAKTKRTKEDGEESCIIHTDIL